jgi:hypothetical protein
MKRLARFLIWLVGGSLSTLAVPAVLFSFVYLARGSKAEHPLAMVYGTSVYFFVPVGLLVSFVIAVMSLRWTTNAAEAPIQPPVPTRGNGT